jgi:hypothetical protein
MSTKRVLFAGLVVSVVVLAVGAQAQPADKEATPPSVTIPYTGQLAEAGQPVAEGAYDFTFALYESELGGEPAWFERQEGVTVQDGAFLTSLGSVEPIPATGLDTLWLAVAVRGPGEVEFTALAPRQRLNAAAPAAPASPNAAPACAHDHWGEDWSGNGRGLSIHSYDSIAVSAIGLSGSTLPVPPSGKYGLYAYGETAGVYGVGPVGIQGYSSTGFGVYGTSIDSRGVYGTSTNNWGVYGVGGNAGVVGDSTDGYGVYGTSTNSAGVYGTSTNEDGVYGYSSEHGVYGETSGSYGWRSGVFGRATSNAANGVTGWNNFGGVGVYGYSETGKAGHFSGPVEVIGYLTKTGGGFKIDHPLAPADKYLNHSFVESPDMMNVYNGNVVLDANGEAWVDLPEWFEALNKEFRYQLTCIGGFAPVYIAQEVQDNHFQIAGGQPGLKVSWQVTGIRHDAYAEAHRIPVEEDKAEDEQGTFLHPTEHGMPKTMGLDYQQYQGQE